MVISMQKFSDTFGNLQIKQELNAVFADMDVERILMNKGQRLIRIYMRLYRLIPKADIFALEKQLQKYLSPNQENDVKICEVYELSDQYTAAYILEHYYESMLLELKQTNMVLYTLFLHADPKMTEDGVLTLSFPNTVVGKNKEPEIQEYLEQVFSKRFHFNIQTDIRYVEPKESSHRRELELRAERMVDEIAKHTAGRTDASSAEDISGVQEAKSTPVKDSTPKETSAEHKADIILKKPSKPARWDKTEKGAWKEKNQKSGGRKEFARALIRSDHPDVIYNREFEGEPSSLDDVFDEVSDSIVAGEVLLVDERITKTGKHIIRIDISDYTDSLSIKLFLNEDMAGEFLKLIKPGDFIKAKGIVSLDKFDKELVMSSVMGIMKTTDTRKKREDLSTRKRVELHCHTKMSDMDAVSDVGDILKQAKRFGHTAMAVTDHGNVQAFPAANHTFKPDDPFKIIYGVEAYLVDDLQQIVTNGKNQSLNASYVVFDIETTGFVKTKNKVIEIGAVKIENGVITERFSEFVNPGEPIPYEIEQLTGINDSMVMDAPGITEILPKFLDFCEGCILVAHNAQFDMGFITYNAAQQDLRTEFTYIDTVGISRAFYPTQAKHTLDAVAKTMGVSLENHHRAVDDAEATAQIFVRFLPMLAEKGITNMEELNAFGVLDKEAVKRLHYYHAIILAKNEIGRRSLYKLVSCSNLDYFRQRPRIPKSKILEYREGLILGSACERGELYQAIVREQDEAQIAKIVSFYDYLEIQPITNNLFQIADEKNYPGINSMEDLMNINRRIVKLGETYHKPVCATCDVHFLNPEDGIYRKIILAGKGFADTDSQPELYFRTTEEMLDEFAYLGMDKAEEVVITNTNMIADMCEKITPVRPDKCPPVIEDSDKTLRKICYDKAHQMYGPKLPKIVEDRLEKELTSIIGNGFAVMYIIAQKLVWKSVEDGFLVGSRGSVGSSFVATMAGITEVNPLSPHYYCTNCYYVDFDSEDVKAYSGRAGCDMPDKICPKCGQKLKKDGFDIPFETFLGFKGDKEPDIDLNFSSEYQSKAHKYTEVIFGYGQTFRAGTIGTLADKTAYGYVRKYFNERNIVKRNAEINRITLGCVGIRRTTGQHPGGIVVLPVGEDISSFTPIQHPADKDIDIITTHHDYHSIDHNLLKLDILGHDDPTMIRMLQDLTGIDPLQIPLDDPEVMTLFQTTKALGVEPEDICGCKLGSLGIPEFGTDFAMQMLIDAKPQSFSDLVRISGLSHGTDVWLGNAQTLIQEGKATISTAICTRDDIMTYLIKMGVESSLAFTIMESVRKGKGLKPEWEEAMLSNNVPDWYIWSCKKIKYMFPKAHAAAYVMMAWRIAYCKINYPVAYYCAFYSKRAKAFSYEIMCMGKDVLERHMREYERRNRGEAQDSGGQETEGTEKEGGETQDNAKSKDQELTNKDKLQYGDMRIVQEMYARGIDFMPIDIYRAKARDFQIIDGKIMPSFSAIEGMGEMAADLLEDAAKEGHFFSKDDLRTRAKLSNTIIETLTRLGLLEGMPQSNQLSIFDFV